MTMGDYKHDDSDLGRVCAAGPSRRRRCSRPAMGDRWRGAQQTVTKASGGRVTSWVEPAAGMVSLGFAAQNYQHNNVGRISIHGRCFNGVHLKRAKEYAGQPRKPSSTLTETLCLLQFSVGPQCIRDVVGPYSMERTKTLLLLEDCSAATDDHGKGLWDAISKLVMNINGRRNISRRLSQTGSTSQRHLPPSIATTLLLRSAVVSSLPGTGAVLRPT
jgi:hypothetical protein